MRRRDSLPSLSFKETLVPQAFLPLSAHAASRRELYATRNADRPGTRT